MPFTALPIPKPCDYAEYYERYVVRLKDEDVEEVLVRQIEDAKRLFGEISEEMGLYRYAEGKWSVKDILQHIIDTERVMAYRALRFSRQDGIPLPGFEQDDWAPTARADQRSITNMVEEFVTVRQGTMALFKSFDEAHWLTEGHASGYDMKTGAIPYIIAGHYMHHTEVLKDRYSRLFEDKA